MAFPAVKVGAASALQPTDAAQDNLQTHLELVVPDEGSFSTSDNVARARRIGDQTVAAPAQLRLQRTNIERVIEPAAPVREPLRAAFDLLPAPITRANLRLLPRNVDAWL